MSFLSVVAYTECHGSVTSPFKSSHFFHLLDDIVLLVPTIANITHEIVLHDIVLTDPNKKKFYKDYLCEYCPAKYVFGDGIFKHLQKCHAMHFEKSLEKYYNMGIRK
jgi:hypothetical protein